MAATFNTSNLTLNPKEVSELSSAIVEMAFNAPMLDRLHRVQTGVQMKEQILLIGQMGMTGVAQSGCGRTSSGATVPMSQKYWEPANFGDRLINCVQDMNALWKAYFGKVTSYQELYDMQGSELGQLLVVLLEEAISKAALRVAWFGDKDVAASGAATAGLIDGTNVKFFDVIDGLWKQIYAGVTATTIAKADLAVTATDSLQAVYNAADSRLRADTNAVFMVTRSVFDKYKAELRAASKNFELETTTEGLRSVRFDGIEVINMENVWNINMNLFEADSTDNLAYLPDRIVFSTPDNLPVGTLNEADLATLKSWYDMKDEVNYTDYGFTIDAKVIEEHMIAVAYGTMPEA